MTCYNPITGYKSRIVNDTGKRSIVFNTTDGYGDLPVVLPCGNCIGCKLDRAKQWAVRCVHEASMHRHNSFITLTYNDENMPENEGVDVEVFKKFWKRLRKKIAPIKIRYFGCGEYGEVCRNCRKHETKCRCNVYIPMIGRPHYHAIVFGYDFPDKKLHSIKNGNPLWTSEELAKIWPYGFNVIGEVTAQSAGYVARYTQKKMRNVDANYYIKVEQETGEYYEVKKEFIVMSRGRRKNGDGGIGYRWYERYKADTKKDYITIERQKTKIPKYYDNLNPEIEKVKEKRRKEAAKRKEDNTIKRLRQKEKVKVAQTKNLKRNNVE